MYLDQETLKMIKHLQEINMSYFTHWCRSMKFAAWSCKMYMVCIFHAMFPWILQDTFSRNVLKLAEQFGEEDAKH
jgi:hypothetical protein